MEMYNVHQDATLLPIMIKTNKYSSGNDSLPAVSGSASMDKNKAVHLSLVNIDSKNAQEISVDLRGIKPTGVTGRILTSAKLQDYNSFENANKIKPVAFSGASLSGNTLKVKLPAFSVVVLEVK